MSVQTEILRLRNSKTSLKNAIEQKGVDVPSSARLSDYAGYIGMLGPYQDDINLVRSLLEGDSQMTTLTIPDSANVTTIKQYFVTIIESSTLTKIVLPSTLTSIQSCAFVPNSAYYVEVDVTKCTQLSTLSSYSFSHVLGTIDLSNTIITTFPQQCFSAFNTSAIIFPNTVDSLPPSLFTTGGKQSLTTLTFLSTTPPTITAYTFSNLTNLQHIYVPEESVDSYKAAQYWKTYASKISAIQS